MREEPGAGLSNCKLRKGWVFSSAWERGEAAGTGFSEDRRQFRAVYGNPGRAVPGLFFLLPPVCFWRNEGRGEEGCEESCVGLNKAFDLEQNISIYRTGT